jgi:hypothetical protein
MTCVINLFRQYESYHWKAENYAYYRVLTHHNVTGLRACHSRCPHCSPRTGQECGNFGGFLHSHVWEQELTVCHELIRHDMNILYFIRL